MIEQQLGCSGTRFLAVRQHSPDPEGRDGFHSPIFMEGQKKVKPRRPPTVGRYTDEVLREAGYDEESIKKLRQDGAIAEAFYAPLPSIPY